MSQDTDATRLPAPGGDAIRRELAAVVPCYNAGGRVRGVVEGLGAILDHVIVVDDGSTDGSAASLEGLPARVVAFPENRGKGFAMLAGFRAALEDPVIQCVAIIDADGQHDPAELSQLYAAFAGQNADLVIGTRTFDMAHVPFRSRLGNKTTATVTRLLLGKAIPDTQSGYRLHSRRLLEHLLQILEGGRYETEMEILVEAVKGGYTVLPVPIQTLYEEGNPSSHFNKIRDSFRIYQRLVATALRRRPPRRTGTPEHER